MEITILQRADGITHVVLIGRLDTNAAEENGDNFSQATAARERPAIIDLSQIDFMASQGISMLLASSKRLQKAGHKLVLLNPQQLVDSSLRTARIETVMPIAYDLDEAIRFIHGQGSAGDASARPESAVDETRLSRPNHESTIPAVLPGELKLEIKNEISELKNVNAALAKFLETHRVPKRAAYAVNLAVDELVVNVMRYAYVDDDEHVIDFELAIQGDQIILRIIDDGRPFDPRTGPKLDLHAEDRQVGGLGLLLVIDMVDKLKYQRIEERNWVEVRIQLGREDDRSDLPEDSGSSEE